MNTKTNNFKAFSILLIYYSLLMYVYQAILSPRWEYRGFHNYFSTDKLLLSIIGCLFTIYTYVVIEKKNKPSSIVMNLFNLLFFIPLYVLVAYQKISEGFFLFVILYQLSLYLFYIFKNFNFRPILFKSKDIFFGIIFFILVATLFINGIYNGFSIKIDLSDVYENRLAARELSMPSILAYIKAASYFVGILALMYALKARNFTMVILVVLLQLMSFAFGASKTQFFSIFICFIAYYFYSDRFKLWAPVALSLLLIFSIIEHFWISTSDINDIWTRRSLFIPPNISHNMYEFFENPHKEFLYLRGSVLRIFGFEDPYAEYNGFQRMIGAIYVGNSDTNANTGLLGNDYAQFGWASIIIYPFLRVYLLKMYDYCSIGVDKRIIVVLSIFIAFTYISGAFFTVLLTNGILLVNYLLYCFPRKLKKKINENNK